MKALTGLFSALSPFHKETPPNAPADAATNNEMAKIVYDRAITLVVTDSTAYLKNYLQAFIEKLNAVRPKDRMCRFNRIRSTPNNAQCYPAMSLVYVGADNGTVVVEAVSYTGQVIVQLVWVLTTDTATLSAERWTDDIALRDFIKLEGYASGFAASSSGLKLADFEDRSNLPPKARLTVGNVVTLHPKE